MAILLDDAEFHAGTVASAHVDSRGVIQSLLIPLDSWPSPQDFLQYLVQEDGRKIPVSQLAFEKVLIGWFGQLSLLLRTL